MDNVTRTVYGSYVQTCLALGIPFTAMANTTLNQKYGVFQNEHVSSNEVPTIGYLGIGNGGHKIEMGANNIAKPVPILFTPDQASLYNQLPFLMRPVGEDISAIDRAKYRIRALVTFNNTPYVAYYLKTIDKSATAATAEYKHVENGIISAYPYVPDISKLVPVPPVVNNSGQNVTVSDYLSVSARIPFIMNATDIEEFRNVCSIIFGDPNYAMISEIAICTGVDRSVTASINGVATGYTEVIDVQVSTFVQTFYALQYSNTEIDVLLDVGSVEPLLIVR